MNLFQTVKSWFTSNHPDTFNEDMSEAELDQAVKEFVPQSQEAVQSAAEQASSDVATLSAQVQELQKQVSTIAIPSTEGLASTESVEALKQTVATLQETVDNSGKTFESINKDLKDIAQNVSLMLGKNVQLSTQQVNNTIVNEGNEKETTKVVNVGSFDEFFGTSKN